MSARSVSRHSHSHKGSQNGLQHMTAAMKSELLECSVSGVPFSADASSPHAPFVLKCGHTFARATIERVRPRHSRLPAQLFPVSHYSAHHTTRGCSYHNAPTAAAAVGPRSRAIDPRRVCVLAEPSLAHASTHTATEHLPPCSSCARTRAAPSTATRCTRTASTITAPTTGL